MTSRLKRQRPVLAHEQGLRRVERSPSEVLSSGDSDVESLHHEPVAATMTSPPHTETPIGPDTVVEHIHRVPLNRLAVLQSDGWSPAKWMAINILQHLPNSNPEYSASNTDWDISKALVGTPLFQISLDKDLSHTQRHKMVSQPTHPPQITHADPMNRLL